MNPLSAMARLEALPGWRWIVSRFARSAAPRIEPRHVPHSERNQYPGLAWDSPLRQLRMAEIAARKVI
jgi:hypothetical protein